MFSLLIEGRTLIKNKLNNLRQTKSKHTTDTSILDKRVRFRSVYMCMCMLHSLSALRCFWIDESKAQLFLI